MVLLKRSVILLLISAFIIFLAAWMIMAFLPQYLQVLGAPGPILQIIITIFLSTLFIFPYFLGKYSDKIQNRKYFVLIGTAGMILIPFLLLFTINLILITIILFIFGVFASTSSLLFTLYSELVQNNSKWISYYNAITALGWFVGAQIAGLFIENYGFNFVFIISLIGMVIGAIFLVFINEDRQIILNSAKTIDLNDSQNIEFSISKSIYYGVFFRSFGIQPIMAILVVIMGFHLANDTEIGFLIGLNPLLQFFLMLLLGRLVIEKNFKFLILSGYGLSIFVIFGFLLAADFWGFLLSQFIVAFSFSIYWMTTITYISKNTTPKNKGVYIGYANTSAFAGNAIGGLFLSLLLTLVNSDYSIAMYFMVIFPIIAIIIILISRRKLFSIPERL
ncbi:MAG: MFS transporter [Promethearchaeota archaeon]